MGPTNTRLKVEHLWGLVAVIGIFVFVNTHPIRPYDFWWHITIGREILSTGEIPSQDIYSYTAFDRPYPSYQMFWLMEIALYAIYRLGGPALVVFIHSLVISAAYLVIFYLCKQLSKSWRAGAFGVLFAAALGLNDWNVRPQAITFLVASLFLLAIYEYKQSRKWIWLIILPVGMLIWVNSHGTFIIGLVLVGIWLAHEAWDMLRVRLKNRQASEKKPAAVSGVMFILTMLACLVNPRGLGIINYLLTLSTNTAVQNLVPEWAPPSFRSTMGIIFFSGLIISAILLVLSPQRPKLYQIAAFLVFGAIGVRTLRGSVWFGLILAPILAQHLSHITSRVWKPKQPAPYGRSSAVMNTMILLIIISMGFASLPWFKSILPLPKAKAGLISAETPVQVAEVLLQQHPPGRLFNSISFGSYLIWAAYPQYQVFVDSRIELFPIQVWTDYLDISNAGDGWEDRLGYYGVNTLMLSPTDQPHLIEAVKQSGDWALLYQDDSAVIFSRN